MRRFPDSWTTVLTSLGFRRERKRAKTLAGRCRRSRVEQLEARQMLSVSPLEESFVLDVAAPLAADPAQVATLDEAALTPVVVNPPTAEISEPVEPVRAQYVLANHGSGNVSSQFRIETEYDAKGAARAVVHFLEGEFTGSDLETGLQELQLELRLGNQVLERQEVLIDIAEADFRAKFLQDRIDAARISIERLNPPSMETVTPAETENIAVATGAEVPSESEVIAEISPSTDDVAERKQQLSDLTAQSETGEIAAVAKSQADFGDVAVTPAERVKLLDLLSAAISKNDTQAVTDQAEQDAKDAERKLLGQSTILLSAFIAADLSSSDPEVQGAAQQLRDQAIAAIGSEYTVFTGLAKNQELRRGATAAGVGEVVIGAVEEGSFQANDNLRIELGSRQAMVQITRRTFSGAWSESAPLQIETRGPVQDAYTDSTAASVAHGTSDLLVSGIAGSGTVQKAFLQFDLSPYVGQPFSYAALELKTAATNSGTGTNQISASKDLFAATGTSGWTEQSLMDSTSASTFASGFSAPLANLTVSNTTSTVRGDVTEAVKRALLLGDSNGSSSLDLRGATGDVDAFYWSIVDNAYYQQHLVGRAPVGQELLYRNDANWDGVISKADATKMFTRWGTVRDDYNLDGVADLRDLSVFMAHYGQATSPMQGGYSFGDGDFDGAIGIGDIALLATSLSSGAHSVTPQQPQLTLRVESTGNGALVKYNSRESSNSPMLSLTREFLVNSLDDDHDMNLADNVADASSAAGEQATLRAAVEQINQLASTHPDMKFAISFAPEVRGKITLGSELAIHAPVTIQGPGVDLLTLSGSGTNRLFSISESATVVVRGITLADGYNAFSGGAINTIGDLTLENVAIRNSRAGANGGGIAVSGPGGKLTLRNSTVDGNQAGVVGFGIGGGIYVLAGRDDALIVERSTISRNSARVAGGLYFAGANTPTWEGRKATIRNTTISGNSAIEAGGIRVHWVTARLSLLNSTVTGNTGEVSGGLDLREGGQAILISSIVAGNENPIAGGPKNISRDTLTNQEWSSLTTTNRALSTHNLIGNSGWDGLDSSKNQILTNNDPQLLPLGNYGGPTETHLPAAGSQAIDRGMRRLEYDELIQADNPIFHFGFDGNANSSVGSVNGTLTPYGTQTPPVGYSSDNPNPAVGAQALKLDVNGYVAVSTPIGASFTFETWARSDTPTWNTYGWIASARQPNGFVINSDNGSKTVSAWLLDSAGGYRCIGAVTLNDIQSWHHYAMSFDHLNGTSVFYVDGIAVETQSSVAISRLSTPSISLNIGRDIYLSEIRYGDGAIDEAALYNSVLSADRIARRVKSFDQRGVGRLEFSSPSFSGTSQRVDVGAAERYATIVTTADFDGDGRDDEVFQDPLTRTLYVTTGPPGSRTVSNWGQLGELQSNAGYWKVGDFDGDGRDDLAIRRANNSWSIALSESTRFKIFDASPQLATFPSWVANQTFVGDFDGDGRDELLGRTGDNAAWQRWTYRDEAGPSIVAAGTSLTLANGQTQTLYVGDANRDGRDDVIAYTSGQWRVSLASATGVLVEPSGTWANNWFADGPSFSADGMYQQLLDIFSDVYNNFELEIYPGLMKGPQATERTKAGNDWDQAALLVDRLRAAGFNDAQIVESNVYVPWQQLQDWLGVKQRAAALVTVINTIDQNAATAYQDATNTWIVDSTPPLEIGTTTHVRFKHAFVQVTAPTETGFSAVYLDPSWKFKTRQDGLAIDLTVPTPASTEGLAYTPPSTLTGSGTFDELLYLKELDVKQSPLAWYESQLMAYLAQTKNRNPMSLADLAYDGPITQKQFRTLTEGWGSGVAIDTSAAITLLQNFDHIANNSDLSERLTHRATISMEAGAVKLVNSTNIINNYYQSPPHAGGTASTNQGVTTYTLYKSSFIAIPLPSNYVVTPNTRIRFDFDINYSNPANPEPNIYYEFGLDDVSTPAVFNSSTNQRGHRDPAGIGPRTIDFPIGEIYPEPATVGYVYLGLFRDGQYIATNISAYFSNLRLYESNASNVTSEPPILSHPIVLPAHSLDAIHLDYVKQANGPGAADDAYTARLIVQPQTGSALTVSSAAGRIFDASKVKLNISHSGPTDFQTGNPAPNTYTRQAGQILSIGFDANQYSRQDIEALTKRVIDVAADGAQLADIDEFTDLTLASYWELYNRESRRVNALMRTLGTQQWVGSGMVTADNALLTIDNPGYNSGAALFTPEQVRHLPFGIAPWNLGIDLPNTNGPSVDLGYDGTPGSSLFSKEANQLRGWNSSYLENKVLEAGIGAESISTVRGLKYAYKGAIANVVQPVPPPANGEDFHNRILVFESTSTGVNQPRTVYFRGYYGVGSTTTYSSTGNTVADLDDNGQLEHLPASTRNQIKALLENTSAVGTTRVLVPERPSRVGTAGQGWDGVVYVSEMATQSTISQGYIIAPLSGEPLHGASSLNQPQEPDPELPVANFDRAVHAGDPVNVANGNMFRDETDVIYANLGYPLSFSRHYDALSKFDIGLGVGWVHSFSDRLTYEGSTVPNAPEKLTWLTSTGALLTFEKSSGIWKTPDSRFGVFEELGGATTPTGYRWRGADGMEYLFTKVTAAPAGDGKQFVARLSTITDRNGHGVQLTYSASSPYVLEQARDIHNLSRRLEFDYPAGHITKVSRVVPGIANLEWNYAYNSAGDRLASVTRPIEINQTTANVVSYLYHVAGAPSVAPSVVGLMSKITEPDLGTHQYDYYPNGRVFRVTESIGPGLTSSQFYSYDLYHTTTEFTDENRRVETYVNDTTGQLTRQVHDDGSFVTFKYGTQSYNKTLMTESVDEVGGKETYVFYQNGSSDSYRRGQLVESTSKDNILSKYTYWTPPAQYSHIHELTKVVRSGANVPSETTDYSVGDDRGNLSSVTNSAGVVTNYTRSTTDPTKYGLVLTEDRQQYASGSSAPTWKILSANLYLQAGELLLDAWKSDAGTFSADAILLERMHTDGTTVLGSWIVDDADAGFELFGSAAQGTGFGGRARNIAGASGQWGRWTFANLPAGTYRLSATWQGSGLSWVNYSAYYRPPAGSIQPPLADFSVNQASAPSGLGHEQRAQYFYDAAGNVTHKIVDGILASKTEYDIFGLPKSTVDASGVTSNSTRDYRGRVLVSGMPDPDGSNGPLTKLETSINYDPMDRVTSTIDPLGRKTTFAYDLKGRLVTETSADGSVVKHTYDGKGNRLQTTDALGRITRFVYDSQNRLVQTIFADGATQRVLYDGAGRVQRTIDPLGRVTEFTYDLAGRLLTTVAGKGTAAQATTVNKYDGLGRLIEEVDPNGIVTKHVLDNAGRVIRTLVLDRSVASPNQTTPTPIPTNIAPISFVIFKYDNNGRLSERLDYDPAQFSAAELTTLLTNQGDLASSSYKRNGKIRSTEMSYDALDRVTGMVYSLDYRTATSYDPSGRAQFSQDELGRITAFQYDAYGRLVKTVAPDPDTILVATLTSPISSLAYDAGGNVIASTDPRGVTTRTQYDQLNRPLATTDGVGAVWRSTYDVAGQMVGSVDPLGVASHTRRDERGRVLLTKEVDPDGVGLALAPTTRFIYDLAGNVTETVDSRGFSTTYAYDALNRVTKESPTISRVADNSSEPGSTTANYVDRDDEFKLVAGTAVHKEGLLAPGPYGRDQSVITGTGGLAAKVQWEFKGLEAGTYRVLITWASLAGSDTAAVPGILINGNPLSGLSTLNQQLPPSDVYREDDRARGWAAVATFTVPAGFPITTPIQVTLTGSTATSTILADAVMLESVNIGTSYAYDDNGNRTLSTDARGNKTRYQYDELNRPTATITNDPDGAGTAMRSLVTWKTYNGFGEVTKSQKGDLRYVINPDLSQAAPFLSTNAEPYRTDVFTYDVRGRLLTEMLADGTPEEVVNHYYYDAAGNQRMEVRAYGSVDEVVTLRDYDKLNRLTKEIVDVGRSATAQGLANDLSSAGDLNPDASLPHGAKIERQTTFSYDAAGNLIDTAERARKNDSTSIVTTRNVYDAAGRVIRTIEDAAGAGALAAVSTTAYDRRGDVLASVDATGLRTLSAYDDLGRLTKSRKEDPDGVNTGQAPAAYFQYDSAGNVIAELNGELEPTFYAYDALGRKVRTISPTRFGSSVDVSSPEPPPNDTETLTRYDGVGNVVAMRDGDYNVTSYAYDTLNRKTSQQSDVQLASGVPVVTATTTWSYKTNGQLHQVIDPRSTSSEISVSKYSKRQYTYDALDRQTDEQWVIPHSTTNPPDVPENSNLTNLAYRHNFTTYDKLGRVTEKRFQALTTPTSSLDIRDTYQYDDLGRVLKHVSEQPNLSSGISSRVTHEYAYDQAPAAGVPAGLHSVIVAQKVASTAGDKDFSTVRTYDRLGREADLREAGTGTNQTLQVASTHDLAGRLKSVVRTQGSAADLVFASSYYYDRAGQLKTLEHAAQDADLYHSYAYTRDAAGRVTSLTARPSAAAPLATDTYTYDETGRLSEYTKGSVDNKTGLDLDDAGNRTDGRAIGPGNHLLEDAQYLYQYDLAGNLAKRISKAAGNPYTTYEWDYRNRLINVIDYDSNSNQNAKLRTASLYYNSQDELVRKKKYSGPSDTFVSEERYDNEEEDRVLVRDGEGRVKERLLYAGEGAAAAVDQVFATNGTLSQTWWTATDHLGTVRDVAGNTGNVVNRLDYDPFGKITSIKDGAGTAITDYKLRAIDAAFAGQILDDDVQFAHHDARWYDPVSQRFVSQDPIAADENLYRYTGGDYVNTVDPTGLYTQTPLDYLPGLSGGYSSNKVTPKNVNFNVGAINALASNVYTAGANLVKNAGELGRLFNQVNTLTQQIDAVERQRANTGTGWFSGWFGPSRGELTEQRNLLGGQRGAASANIRDIFSTSLFGGERAEISSNPGATQYGSVAGALGSGFNTGGKAVINAGAGTAVSFGTLGFRDYQGPFGVTQQDLYNGYNTSYAFARGSTELLAGVATGGLASYAKAGSAIRVAGKAAVAYDFAGNVVGVGRGTADAYNNGLSFGNSVQIVGSGLGLGGNLAAGGRALREIAEDTARVRVSFDPATLSSGGLGGAKFSLAQSVTVPPTAAGRIHGNSLTSPRTAYLYRLEDVEGNFLKWGVTQDLGKRYPKSYLEDKVIRPWASGTRADIIRTERGLVETQPGPLNFERWAGSRLGGQP